MQPNPAFPVMIKGKKGFQKPITFNQKKNWCLQVLSIGDIGFSAGFKDSYWVHLWGLTPGSDTKPIIPADFVKNLQPMFSLSLSHYLSRCGRYKPLRLCLLVSCAGLTSEIDRVVRKYGAILEATYKLLRMELETEKKGGDGRGIVAAAGAAATMATVPSLLASRTYIGG